MGMSVLSFHHHLKQLIEPSGLSPEIEPAKQGLQSCGNLILPAGGTPGMGVRIGVAAPLIDRQFLLGQNTLQPLKGLGLGADDYMVKPFLPKELSLRIGIILRRYYKGEDPIVQLAGSQIDFDRAEVIKENEHFPLTAKEHDILLALYRNAGRIVTIDQLCEAAWGDNPYGYENSLMAHIRRIREKIEANPSKPVSLITVKGLGYKLVLAGK